MHTKVRDLKLSQAETDLYIVLDCNRIITLLLIITNTALKRLVCFVISGSENYTLFLAAFITVTNLI